MSGILDLKKSLVLNLEKSNFPTIPTMETKLAIDCSGSMDEEFAAGWVDHMVCRFYAAAMEFDDNHTLDVGAFNNNYHEMPSVSSDPGNNYIRNAGLYANGGTAYAPVIENMAHQPKEKSFFDIFKKKSASVNPVYLGMITDGDCQDQNLFERRLSSIDSSKTFIQMIAIGNQVNLPYLRRVESKYGNVSVMHLPNPKSVSDDGFYQEMCNAKFKAWIELITK